MQILPKARTTDILEQEADRELLIYDLRIDKAYNLNETLKVIYKACGKLSFEELKRKHNFTDDLIYFGLDELKKNNLIEDDYASMFAEMNRREVVRKVGLASIITLPVISSLIAPSAALAASRGTQANNTTCTTLSNGNSTECQSGYCVSTLPFNVPQCCISERHVGRSGRSYSVTFPFCLGADGESVATTTCCNGRRTLDRCIQSGVDRYTTFYTCQ